MSITKHKIEVEFSPTEFDYSFYLEGKKPILFPYPDGKLKNEFENFLVEDELDIHLVTLGFEGTRCTLVIKVDGKTKKYTRTVSKKGLAVVVDSLKLPIK